VDGPSTPLVLQSVDRRRATSAVEAVVHGPGSHLAIGDVGGRSAVSLSPWEGQSAAESMFQLNRVAGLGLGIKMGGTGSRLGLGSVV